jgi:hypothetical protein
MEGLSMAHPYHHAVRSARLFGGKPEDYLAIHNWFDESKAHLADFRHRALRHHSEGIFRRHSLDRRIPARREFCRDLFADRPSSGAVSERIVPLLQTLDNGPGSARSTQGRE